MFGSKRPLVQRVQNALSVVLILILLGLLIRPLESSAWKTIKAGQPEMKLKGIEHALGQGLVPARQCLRRRAWLCFPLPSAARRGSQSRWNPRDQKGIQRGAAF